MRQTITVPAAGEELKVSLTGQSIIVESAGSYANVDDVPRIKLGDGGTEWGIYPQWVYPSETGHFRNVTIIGTAESAGNEITLVSTKICLPFSTNNQFSDSFSSKAGETSSKPASNAVQQFTELELQNADGKLPNRLYVYVIGNPAAPTNTRGINYAYNADPSQGDHAEDAYYLDNDRSHTPEAFVKVDPLEIIGLDWILNFRFIATIADETPNVIWTGNYK